MNADSPNDAISDATDDYFLRTAQVAARAGDCSALWAAFLRVDAIGATAPARRFLAAGATARCTTLDLLYAAPDGLPVPARAPHLIWRGSLAGLAPLETGLLQRLGAVSVAAANARAMALALPSARFIAMDARHAAGPEMADLMAEAARIGSDAAIAEGAIGFVGSSTKRGAAFFGLDRGLGTMPHALIGFAGSTLRAAELYRETFPDEPLTVLIDYAGAEITDALAIARRFPDLAAAGRLALRVDTPGERYLQGLDPDGSTQVLASVGVTVDDARNAAHLIGPGTSAAAFWHLRNALDEAGFQSVRLVGSSGFSAAKCRAMATARAPLDVVGTGSFLPDRWTDTYATADIVAFDGAVRVKAGRRWLVDAVRTLLPDLRVDDAGA